MPILMLMRHAKAAKATPGMRDFDRPLEPRGTADAAVMGEELRQRFGLPARVLCSAARRTRETLDSSGLGLPEDQVTYSKELFDADGAGYRRIIEGSGDWERLLVIGHNPSIAEASLALADTGDADDLRQLAAGFPTSSVAVIELDGGPSLRPGRLLAFLSTDRA